MKIYLIAGSIRDVIQRRRLSLVELPGFARRHGFEGIEISDRELIEKSDSTLEDLSAACAEIRCGVVVDIGCDLTLSAGKRLDDQIEHVGAMIRTAKLLKARGLRIWLGGQRISIQRLLYGAKKHVSPSEKTQDLEKGVFVFAKRLFSSKPVTGIAHLLRERMPSPVSGLEVKTARAVASLRRIVEDRDAENLFFAVENHWGISAQPDILLGVIKAVGSARLGTCPDFANFPRDVDRYEGLRKLAPHAFLAHAKLKAKGSPMDRNVDFLRCLAILKESAFDGICSVEHDGPGDGFSNCLTMQRLIREHW